MSKTSKSVGRLTSPPEVFLNLYKVAEKRKEKSLDSHRRAKQKEIESESAECTFKPDFSKTIRKTNRLSSNSKYLTFKVGSECNTKRSIPRKAKGKENRLGRGSFVNNSLIH